MTTKYPAAFIEHALVRAFSHGQRSIMSVAEDLNVHRHTLRYRIENKVVTNKGAPTEREKRPQD